MLALAPLSGPAACFGGSCMPVAFGGGPSASSSCQSGRCLAAPAWVLLHFFHSSPFPLRTSTPDKGARYINSPSALVCDWFPRSACVFVAIAPLRPCCAPILLPFALCLAELCPFLWAWPSGPSAHPALRLWLVSLRSYLAYLCRPHASFALDSCRPFVPAFAGGSLYLAPLVAFHSHGLGLCLLPRLPP